MKKELAQWVSAQVCLHSCMTGLRMAAPLMLLRAGESAAAIGVLLALFALSQVFLALPAGQMAERHGVKLCFTLASVVASAGALLAALWPHTLVLGLAALCSGAACGLVIIALQRHVGRMTEDVDQLRSAFSWLSIGPAISNFIGPLSAGVVIDVIGFRSAYFLMALLPLVGWLILRGVHEHRPVQSVKQDHSESAWQL